RGLSQSPLPASSCSNEQPRRRKNQEAEIPPGSIVDLFTQILRQVSRNAQPEESLNMEYLNILKTIKCLDTLAACNYRNLTDLVERAVNVEVAVAVEAKNESKRKGVSGQKGKQIVQFKDSSKLDLSRKRSHDSKSWNGNQGCFYCGEVGHIARHCVAEQAALAEEHPPLALLEDRPPRKRRNRI
ncbi:hypothetical protein HID58_055681, partial [Brassica napus]